MAAEDEPQFLSGADGVAVPAQQQSVSQFEIDSQLSQIQSEIRSQRDLTDLRLNTLENEIEVASSYTERLLFAFLIAGGLVTFVVLVTLNKQSNVNNERMRNLIREAESSLDDLHRLLDRPEAEHFHVSRKLHRIMNKMRERENISLPQKDINDIFAASEDPTLPVTLHLQSNALRNEQRGDWSSAIHLWEMLLTIDDTSPEVLLHLAQNYKRLAEVSSGDMAARMRNASLDYFQKYTTRTNMRTHSERELRKMASLGIAQEAVVESSALPPQESKGPKVELPPAAPAPAEQIAAPIPKQDKGISFSEYKQLKTKKPAKAKVTPKRRKSVADSLLASRKSTVSQVVASGPLGRPAQGAAQKAPQGNGSAAATVGHEGKPMANAPAPDVGTSETKAEQATVEKQEPTPSQPSGNGDGKPAVVVGSKEPAGTGDEKPAPVVEAKPSAEEVPRQTAPAKDTKSQPGEEGKQAQPAKETKTRSGDEAKQATPDKEAKSRSGDKDKKGGLARQARSPADDGAKKEAAPVKTKTPIVDDASKAGTAKEDKAPPGDDEAKTAASTKAKAQPAKEDRGAARTKEAEPQPVQGNGSAEHAPPSAAKQGQVAAKAKARSEDKSMVNGEQAAGSMNAKALKSRKDKAKEYFGRYGTAKTKKDKIQWLEAAQEEYKAAARYSDDVDLYRLWGSTILEMAAVDTGNTKTHVPKAIDVFASNKSQQEGVFCNELSLCHAILGDEVNCRKALEQAKQMGQLDADYFLGLPEFEKYRDIPWFRALSEG